MSLRPLTIRTYSHPIFWTPRAESPACAHGPAYLNAASSGQAALWGAYEACVNASARGALIAAGIQEAAVAAFAAHEEAVEIQEAFCALFSELFRGAPEGRSKPGEKISIRSECGVRAVGLVAHAMARAPLAPGVQTRGSGAVAAAAASGDEAVCSAAAGASLHALQVLRVFGDDHAAQIAAAGAMASVFAAAAAGAPAVREAVEVLVDRGVVGRLVDLTVASTVGVQARSERAKAADPRRREAPSPLFARAANPDVPAPRQTAVRCSCRP